MKGLSAACARAKSHALGMEEPMAKKKPAKKAAKKSTAKKTKKKK
jgi:hypothetical protein